MMQQRPKEDIRLNKLINITEIDCSIRQSFLIPQIFCNQLNLKLKLLFLTSHLNDTQFTPSKKNSNKTYNKEIINSLHACAVCPRKFQFSLLALHESDAFWYFSCIMTNRLTSLDT
jgi:hypothetical protein